MHNLAEGAGWSGYGRGMVVRPARPDDYEAWRPLYDGYNAFYGRQGPTALPEARVQAIWERFFKPEEPVRALVAEEDGALLGIAHYLFHRSILHLDDVCYLQDIFTDPQVRGRGMGRSLIEEVYRIAQGQGCPRVYWMTQETNTPGRALYDKVADHNGFIVYTHDFTSTP